MRRLPGPLVRWYHWVYDHLPDGWFDLRTVSGFVAGLFGFVHSLVLFALLLVLVVLLGHSEPSLAGAAERFAPWVLVGAFLVAAVRVYAFQRYEPYRRRLEDPDTGPRVTLATRLVVYGTFTALAVWNTVLAVLAAMGYLGGGVVVVLLFFLPAQVRRLVGTAS